MDFKLLLLSLVMILGASFGSVMASPGQPDAVSFRQLTKAAVSVHQSISGAHKYASLQAKPKQKSKVVTTEKNDEWFDYLRMNQEAVFLQISF